MASTEMTLTEAAQVLGIPKTASKAEINKASRTLIARYHPDAWRNKPTSEQKMAEEKYIKVNAAKKIMLDPSLALPEQDDSPQYQPQTQATYGQTQRPSTSYDRPYSSYNRDATSGRYSYSSSVDGGQGQQQPQRTHRVTVHGQSQNAGRQNGTAQNPRGYGNSHASGRDKYNQATSFKSSFGQRPDPAEAQIAKEIERNAAHRYKQFADVFRITASMISSIALIACALVTMISYPQETLRTYGFGAIAPFLILVAAGFVKLLAYDLIASFYVHRKLKERVNKGTIVGIEGIVLASVGVVMALAYGASFIPFAAMAGVMLLITVISVIVRTVSKRDAKQG